MVPSAAITTMLGKPGEPKASKVSLFRSTRDDMVRLGDWKNSAALTRVSSAVGNCSMVSTGKTTIGKPLCDAQSEKSCVARRVFQQSAHHEAQKPSTTTEPWNWRRETFCPARFSNSKSGAGLPVASWAASKLVRLATATFPLGSKVTTFFALANTFGAHSPETLMNTSLGAP